jgi:glutaredoxin 2
MYWLNGIASQLSLDCTVSKDNNSSNTATTKDKDEKTKTTSFPKSLDIVSIKPSHHASLFITCTRSVIYLWSVKVKTGNSHFFLSKAHLSNLHYFKPTTVLSFVERSENHIDEFGENIEVIWKPDASSIVVRVSNEFKEKEEII